MKTFVIILAAFFCCFNATSQRLRETVYMPRFIEVVLPAPNAESLGKYLFSYRYAHLMFYKSLKEVVVTRKKTGREMLHELDERYTSGLFKMDETAGYAGYDFIHDSKLTVYGNVDIFLTSGAAYFGLKMALASATSPPVYFLDEMPIDVTMLAGVSLLSVAYIKIIGPPFMGSGVNALGVPYHDGGGGAIAIYTKKWEDITGKPENEKLKIPFRYAAFVAAFVQGTAFAPIPVM